MKIDLNEKELHYLWSKVKQEKDYFDSSFPTADPVHKAFLTRLTHKLEAEL